MRPGTDKRRRSSSSLGPGKVSDLGRIPLGRSRWLAVAIGAVTAFTLSASAASAAQVPDPLAPGPYSTTKIDYEAGNWS
jgi:hypothetical protein